MRNAGKVQNALAGLVEKFVSDVLTLVQRATVVEASSLKAPKVRASGKASGAVRAAGRPAKKGTGKPGRPPKLSEAERQRLVAKALKVIAKTEGGATMKLVQDAIGEDPATTKRLLRDLVKQSLVRTAGNTRGTRYHPLDGGSEA